MPEMLVSWRPPSRISLPSCASLEPFAVRARAPTTTSRPHSLDRVLHVCIAKTYSSYCHIDYCYCVRTIGHAVKNAYPKATQIEYQPYRKSFWPQTVFRFVPIIHCALYEYECTAYCFPWYYVLLGPPRPLLYTCNGSRPGGPQRPPANKTLLLPLPLSPSTPFLGALGRSPATTENHAGTRNTCARSFFFGPKTVPLHKNPIGLPTRASARSQHAPSPPHIFIIYS